jgi:hypothetical protein
LNESNSGPETFVDKLEKPSQGRPHRRRRRLAVLFVLLVPVAIWWNWPRGDVRFVGTWGLHRQKRGQPSFVFHMHRNGGGWATDLLNGRFTRLNWEVKNDILTTGYGRSGAPPGHVLDVTQNEIRIQPGSGAVEIMSLRRLN